MHKRSKGSPSYSGEHPSLRWYILPSGCITGSCSGLQRPTAGCCHPCLVGLDWRRAAEYLPVYSALYVRKEELQSNPLHGVSCTFGFAASAWVRELTRARPGGKPASLSALEATADPQMFPPPKHGSKSGLTSVCVRGRVSRGKGSMCCF